MTITEQLATYRATSRRGALKLTRDRAARDNAIRAAVAEGMSYRQVAAATGLSHSRVGQIVTTRPRGDA